MAIDRTYIQEFKKKLLELKPIKKLEIEIDPEVPQEDFQELIDLAIQAVDAMDLIYQSAIKTGLKEWGAQIERVINDYLKLLESHGIEEVNVLGKYLNGESMLSIGTVPESFQIELQKFQVYAVHERGFRYKETGKLIREAKVITIY